MPSCTQLNPTQINFKHVQALREGLLDCPQHPLDPGQPWEGRVEGTRPQLGQILDLWAPGFLKCENRNFNHQISNHATIKCVVGSGLLQLLLPPSQATPPKSVTACELCGGCTCVCTCMCTCMCTHACPTALLPGTPSPALKRTQPRAARAHLTVYAHIAVPSRPTPHAVPI